MRLVLIESADGAAGRLLAARLAAAGLPEAECLSCDFTQDALTEAIAEALRSADMVVVAGGLTPPDGAARAAAAAALCCALPAAAATPFPNTQGMVDAPCAGLPALPDVPRA
ncbi:MAG: hypothetical protein RRY21_02685, partial [Oscillospiraceae bacterium]